MATTLLESVITYIAGGQLAQNVLHFQTDLPVSPNYWEVAKNFNAALQTPASGTSLLEQICDCQSEECFVSSIRARTILPVPGSTAIIVFAVGDYPGTINDHIYSQAVAANLKFVTASGADKVGRMFIPGIAEQSLVQGRWDSTFKTTAITLCGGLQDGIDSADGLWVLNVLSRPLMGTEDVTNVRLMPNPGTIRKRLSPI